jgi:hypothetical protein
MLLIVMFFAADSAGLKTAASLFLFSLSDIFHWAIHETVFFVFQSSSVLICEGHRAQIVDSHDQVRKFFPLDLGFYRL